MKNTRILLIEDNPVNQKLARILLEKLGCVVETSNNGEEGVADLTRGDFDLVFMDCQMPVMDGYTASGKIRKLAGPKSKTPIVAMTANALRGDREKCIEAGMNDYLSKPVSSDSMRDIILKWAARAGGEEPSQRPALTPTEFS